MSDLEPAIAAWRRQMQAAGMKRPVLLEELEGHLREEIERQMAAGIPAGQAVARAGQELGPPDQLKTEFQKEPAGWGGGQVPLAWVAWGAFLSSLALPACGQLWGWQCAGLAATAVSWPDFFHQWMTIHLALLTLANLFMLAAPFCLARWAGCPRAMTWLRYASLTALLLVWSFLAIGLVGSDGGSTGLRVGSYLWALSFGLLRWATIPKREHRRRYL